MLISGDPSRALHPPAVSSVRRSRATVGPLAEAEHYELGGLHRSKSNVDDELAAVPHVHRVVLRVTLDEESLIRGDAEQCAVAPDPGQECPHVAADPGPQIGIVRL